MKSPLCPFALHHWSKLNFGFKQALVGYEIYWYVYAKWQANQPIFKRNPKARLKGIVKRGKNPEYTCHQYIGRVGSSTGLGSDPLVTEAYQEWENREQLDAIDIAPDEIENALIRVMPENNHKA
ncbi:hypothetical protein [Nostoc sp.]|uniref:hypothetical protein n=1 Tax=Nostoc sp. TaxID=1180 RepID=UPI002FF70135